MPDRQTEIRNAQAQVTQLEAQKRQLNARLASAPQAEKSRIQTLINDINNRISGARTVLQRLTQAVDLVRQVPGGQQAIDRVGQRVGSAIDQFLEKHGNKSFEIVRTPRFSLTFPTPIALIQVSGSATLTLSGALRSQRSGTTITSSANLTGSLNGRLGINIGAKIAGYQVGLEGGINVSANATGTSTLTLSASGTDLSASMNPADININASASLFLTVSPGGWIVERAIDNFVLPNISGASRSGSTINYPLGRVDLLVVRTPIYSLTFSIAQARFSLNRSGSYSCRVHPSLVSRFNALKRAVGL